MSQAPSHVVLLDFDGTCTQKPPSSIYSVLEEDEQFDPRWIKETRSLSNRFLPRSLTGRLSQAEELEWITRSLKLFKKYQIPRELISRSLSRIKLRPGLKETLEFLKIRQIPVAIISFGIADFIEMILEKKGLSPLVKQIFATRMIFDNTHGTTRDFIPETIVLPNQKGKLSREFAECFNVAPTNILAIGDSGADRFLGHHKRNRLGLAATTHEKNILEEFMGKVFITDDFYPAQQWLAGKIENK